MTHKSDAKFEKKADFLFQKWQVFGDFWPELSKSLKLLLLLVPFVQGL